MATYVPWVLGKVLTLLLSSIMGCRKLHITERELALRERSALFLRVAGEMGAGKKNRHNYYPFGMLMPGRDDYKNSEFRFSFNGKEKDDAWKGSGNSYDYGFRIYDPRIAKFLSVDPLTKDYPWYTPYQFAGNKPIWAVDLDGKEEYFTSSGELIGKYGTSTETRIVFDEYIPAAQSLLSTPNSPNSEVLNNVLSNKGSAGAFPMPDDAANDWGMRYNKKSIDDDKEYGSFLFYTKINGKFAFSYTKPVAGEKDNVKLSFTFKKDQTLLGAIHSHGAYDPVYNSNEFSTEFIDANGNKAGDIYTYKTLGINGYVTTPNGSLQKFSPALGIELINCDMPSDKDDPEADASADTQADKSKPIIQ